MRLFESVCSGELSFAEAKQALESMYPGKDFKKIIKKIGKKFFKNAFGG